MCLRLERVHMNSRSQKPEARWQKSEVRTEELTTKTPSHQDAGSRGMQNPDIRDQNAEVKLQRDEGIE